MNLKYKVMLIDTLPLILFAIPMVIFLYIGYGNPSEGFLEVVSAVCNLIAVLIMSIVFLRVAMVLYASPEESKRRRDIKCHCK